MGDEMKLKVGHEEPQLGAPADGLPGYAAPKKEMKPPSTYMPCTEDYAVSDTPESFASFVYDTDVNGQIHS